MKTKKILKIIILVFCFLFSLTSLRAETKEVKHTDNSGKEVKLLHSSKEKAVTENQIEILSKNISKEIQELASEITETQRKNENKIILNEVETLKEKAKNYIEVDGNMVEILNGEIDNLYEKAKNYSGDLDFYLIKEIIREIREINEKIQILEESISNREEQEKLISIQSDHSESDIKVSLLSKENLSENIYFLIFFFLFTAGVVVFISKNKVSRIEGFGAKIIFNNKKSDNDKVEEEAQEENKENQTSFKP